MPDKSAIVIGAGPAGLTAAYRLAQAGYSVKVFEAGNEVGGLCRSFELWGQNVDLGPHRFLSPDRIVNDFWHEIVNGDHTKVDRITRIYFRNRFFFYPLQPLNALFGLGAVEAVASILSYLSAKAFGKRNWQCNSFEEWVTSRFGLRLYRLFFKSYTEKVWGIPCSRIDAEWAAQRIQKLSLLEAVKSALGIGESNRHKSLVEQFNYPKHGTGSVYKRIAAGIQKYGGQVILQSPVREIVTETEGGILRAKGVRLANGTTCEAAHIISTMPLTSMIKGLKQAPPHVLAACDRLYYRNSILLYLEADSPDLFPDNWIYVHSDEVQHGRITNFRNWCPTLHNGKNTTILCLEFWCFDNDPIWKLADADLAELGVRELRKIELISPQIPILNHKVIRVPKSYPVYELGYKVPLQIIQSHVESIDGLYTIGRYGAFKYNNQDHSILMGLLAAREISTGQKVSLWSINSGDAYQEKDAPPEAAP